LRVWVAVTLVLALSGAWSGATGTIAPAAARAKPHPEDHWKAFPLAPIESPTPGPTSGSSDSPASTPTAAARPAPPHARGEDGSDLAPTIIVALGIGSFLLVASAELTPSFRRRRGAAAVDESGLATSGGSRPTDAPARRPLVDGGRHGSRPDGSGHWSGGRVLVLNARYEPINVCTVRRARVLLLEQKAEAIEIGPQDLHWSPQDLHWSRGSMTKPVAIRLVTYTAAGDGHRRTPDAAGGPRTDRFERSAVPPPAAPAGHTPPERVTPAQPASATAPAKGATGKKRAARSPSKKAPARTAAVPVRCEIICRQNSSRSRFEAIGFTADDRPAWLAESAGFRVGTGRQVERSSAALTAHELLVEHLTRRGWKRDGNGEAWYEARFRRKDADA
jgi:hypothetical protein